MEIIMKKGVVVNMQNDLEARPIALLVQKANQFSSQIYMESGDNKRVNVKSIMGMMSMALLRGCSCGNRGIPDKITEQV